MGDFRYVAAKVIPEFCDKLMITFFRKIVTEDYPIDIENAYSMV